MIAEEYEHSGVKVAVHHEEHDTEMYDPRDWDNVGVMFCWHPDYTLGDEQFAPDSHRDAGYTFHRMEDVVRYLQDERHARVILPLFLLDHSGITIRAGEPILGDPEKDTNQERLKSRGRFIGDDTGWDTTHVGFIYTNDEEMEKMGVDPANALKCLRQEVEVYDQYLTGDIYFYIVGEDTPFEQSLSGIFGFEEAKKDANEMAEHIAKKLERESEEAEHWAARDTVTI